VEIIFPISRKMRPTVMMGRQKTVVDIGTPEAVEERRGPGRPRGFDRSAALHAAMLVFWNYGFEGTSFTDLTEATGMSKPTLYATFGDKVSFFREAVVAYTALSAEAYEEARIRSEAGRADRLLRGAGRADGERRYPGAAG
jgi:AcrR family transcriptional regulator